MKLNKKMVLLDILVLLPSLAFVYLYETYLLSFYFSEKLSTYYAHVQFGLVMAEEGNLSSPHFLYQVFVIGVANLFFPNSLSVLEDFMQAGYLVSVGVMLVLFLLLYVLFRRVVKREDIWSPVLSASMAVFFMVGSAVNALVFLDGHTYFGYLPLNVYNSPTHTLLKLCAVPLFIMSGAVFIPTRISNKWLIFGTALFSVLSALAKPSFTVIILPAVGLLVVYKWFRKEHINWPLFIVGLVIPSVLVLGWQYYISYAGGWGDLARRMALATRIAFMPFGQFTRWEVPLGLLLPKLILSALFPIVVYIAYWKTARKDLAFNLGWLVLLFGCLSTYLFVEVFVGGGRAGKVSVAGNFTWSGLIGIYILFVAAALFFLKQTFERLPVERSGWVRLGASLVALALHVIFGLVWYFDQFRVFAEKIY